MAAVRRCPATIWYVSPSATTMRGVIWPFTSMLRASPETSPRLARFCSLLSTHWESEIFVVSIFLTSCSVWPRPLWAGLVARAPAGVRAARKGGSETRQGSEFPGGDGRMPPSRKVFAALARCAVPGRACGSQGRQGRDVRGRWRERRKALLAEWASCESDCMLNGLADC